MYEIHFKFRDRVKNTGKNGWARSQYKEARMVDLVKDINVWWKARNKRPSPPLKSEKVATEVVIPSIAPSAPSISIEESEQSYSSNEVDERLEQRERDSFDIGQSTVVLFDDKYKFIFLERKGIRDGNRTTTNLGHYRSFEKCEIVKSDELSKSGELLFDIQFVFKNETKMANDPGTRLYALTAKRNVNAFWRRKRKEFKESQRRNSRDSKEVDPPQTVQVVVQSPVEDTSSVPTAPSISIEDNDVPPGYDGIDQSYAPSAPLESGNSEGNIMGNAETEQLRFWMGTTVRLPEYTVLLIDNGFDRMDLLSNLSLDDLKEMGITKIGHRKKIMEEVGKIMNAQSVDGLFAPHQDLAFLPSYSDHSEQPGSAVLSAYDEGQ